MTHRPLRGAVLFGLLLLALAARAAGTLVGTVSHVTDGDSFWLRPSHGGPPVQVRLHGLDAPEICQPHGHDARDALAARVLHRAVRVRVQARDTYHRLLGRADVQGEDLGAWLVQHGHAWSYRFRGRTGPYAHQQALAQQARRGLWADAAPLEPRVFRKQHGRCH